MAQKVQNYQLDPQNPQIIFILGGPGSGKGTQCERLVRDFHFEHISVGEVIREILDRGGPEAERLRPLVEQGELIPDYIVIDGLEETIKIRKAQKYLIDGFPRNLDQAKLFEAQIKEIDMIVNIDCSEDLLTSRLLKRAETSGRPDDNEETIKNRIKVYNEKTRAVAEYYKKFGKIKQIDGSQAIDNVYAQVKKAIKPNLIFFMGPPAVGKTTVAKILAQKLRYLYVDLEEFIRQYKCQNQEDLSNALMLYCNSVSHNCIIIDSFFTDHNQADVFFKHFATPQYVFYLDSPKDEVYMNISKYYSNEKQKKYQQAQYAKYVNDRVGLLKLMQGQKYFKQIKADATIQNIVQQIFAIHKPLTLVGFEYNNQDLGYEYYGKMESERGFIYCDMEEMVEHEYERGTQLGRKIGAFINSSQKVPNNFKIELVQKIMFNEPDNQKFIYSNWPINMKDFESFEQELYPVDYLMNFQQQNQEYQFKYKEDPFLNFFSKGKVMSIDRDAIDILDSYTTPRSTYGFVAGPTAGGKSTIAKHIATQFDYELIEFNETFLEIVKAKYIKEEDEVQEVGYKHIELYFIERLNPAVKSKTVIFDSFPYEAELNNFISKVGLPTFIVNLRVNKDPLVKRYKEKNEMDKEAELGEEDQAKIEEILKKDQDQTDGWQTLSQANFGVKLYNINADLPLESTKRYVNQIFYKRVFVVSDYLDYRQQGQPDYSDKSLDEIRVDQRLIFLNLCAKRSITFVDVQQLLTEHFKNAEQSVETQNQYQQRWTKTPITNPSNYTPQLILQIVQNFLSSMANQTRDVMLYNYPSADFPLDKNNNEIVFPRASDELKLIEDNLGPVRMVTVLTRERVQHVIQDPVWEMEKPEEKPKPKEGEEGEEGEGEKEAEPEADEEEGGKPKFNKFDFTWTQSNGFPKSLPQWFNKTRKTLKKHYSLQEGSENTFERLSDYLNLIDEENEQNKEEQDFRKVNIFVQLRYDNVEEEDEIDPPEPESEVEDENKEDEDDNNEEKPVVEGEQQEGENNNNEEAQEEEEQ